MKWKVKRNRIKNLFARWKLDRDVLIANQYVILNHKQFTFYTKIWLYFSLRDCIVHIESLFKKKNDATSDDHIKMLRGWEERSE